MIKKKFILKSLLTSTAISPFIFIASCSSSNINTDNSTNKSNEKNSEVKKELENFDIKIAYSGHEPQPTVYANEPLTSDFKSNLSDEILSKYKFEVIGLLNPNAKEGTVEVKYKLVNLKDSNDSIEKVQVVGGFFKHPFGVFRNGDISSNHKLAITEGELLKYTSKTRLERFNEDNAKYMELLKRQDRAAYLKNDLSDEQIAKLDKQAFENNQETFKNAMYKGFSVPYLDKSGKAIGLNLNMSVQVGKGPSLIDEYVDEPYSLGLARTLPSKTYKQIGLQTYSLYFNNPGVSAQHGTTWILDFKKPEAGKYPTTWYFATNVHVADGMKFVDDKNYPTRSKKVKTNTVQFLRLKNDVGTRTTFRPTRFGDEYENWAFGVENNPFKTIYMGLNFLKSSPKEYLAPDSPFADTEEMADFAVFEVDFTKFNLNEVRVYTAGKEVAKNYKTHEELAKDMTNDYATKTNEHIKFLSTSYLKDYDKIGRPFANHPKDPVFAKNGNKVIDGLFALGYPITGLGSWLDFFLDKYEDANDLSEANNSLSLWVNGYRKWYKKLGTSETAANTGLKDEELDKGNTLSTELGYRSFITRPGILDMMIGSPFSNKSPYEYPADEDKINELPDSFATTDKPNNFKNRYLSYGINYFLRHFAAGGGASGTSVRNQKNELVGIVHSSSQSARTSLASAFRSEGVTYNGYYGPYQMEEYDLIYGGGKNQRSSYREALQKLYGDSYQTNLFDKGLKLENVPQEFKLSDKKINPSEFDNSI
ncbi:Ig-specific serine endopeptidase MIP [Mycoplasmopsis alligatoris]|uniref:Lipofamily protein n=1 Tax=Mycoplasmopsis alligatoris A21JP2 TaxID=747682 RepID=D4XVB5_9BACT|nr:DUF31 family protein [Mycoplasmopsis alligatoris]EFF41622.1 lipofamily protein [Mycoplasmopsis alligatoris A21JP2]